MMTKEGSTKFVDFMTFRLDSHARSWPYKSPSKNALFH